MENYFSKERVDGQWLDPQFWKSFAWAKENVDG
jgi:hypothetical protein